MSGGGGEAVVPYGPQQSAGHDRLIGWLSGGAAKPSCRTDRNKALDIIFILDIEIYILISRDLFLLLLLL
jgi:hypothetical protein